MSKLFVLLMALVMVGGFTGAQSVPMISDKEARSHLLKGVDPLYPPIAQVAHVAGEAVMYVDIDAEGNVTKMKAVSCPPMLVTSAAEAVRGWKFAPFQVDGKDAAVTVEIKLAFPTLEPRPESKIDAKIAGTLAGRRESCLAAERKQAWTKAIELCKDAVTTTESFPQESVRSREILQAHVAYGRAFAGNDQWQEALEQFLHATGVAKRYLYQWDPALGDVVFLTAATETRLKKNDDADISYSTAEKVYRDAIAKFSANKDSINNFRLAEVLARHAAVVDEMGRTQDAAKMREEAKAIDPKVALTNLPPLPQFSQN